MEMPRTRHASVIRATPPCHRLPLASPPSTLSRGLFMTKGFGVARGLALLLAGTSFVSIAQAGEVAGSVADASGTRARQAASVRLNELGCVATTGRAGNFSFANVTAGTHTLGHRPFGRHTGRQSVQVPQTRPENR